MANNIINAIQIGDNLYPIGAKASNVLYDDETLVGNNYVNSFLINQVNTRALKKFHRDDRIYLDYTLNSESTDEDILNKSYSYSICIGQDNELSGTSFQWNKGTCLIGRHLRLDSPSLSCFTVGQYNTYQSNTLFIVGNGSSNDDRKNAFEVRYDGSILSNGKTISKYIKIELNSNNAKLYYGGLKLTKDINLPEVYDVQDYFIQLVIDNLLFKNIAINTGLQSYKAIILYDNENNPLIYFCIPNDVYNKNFNLLSDYTSSRSLWIVNSQSQYAYLMGPTSSIKETGWRDVDSSYDSTIIVSSSLKYKQCNNVVYLKGTIHYKDVLRTDMYYRIGLFINSNYYPKNDFVTSTSTTTYPEEVMEIAVLGNHTPPLNYHTNLVNDKAATSGIFIRPNKARTSSNNWMNIYMSWLIE